MTETARPDASEMVHAIRAFLASCDLRDSSDQQILAQLSGRLHSELYRRERRHREWIDHGGEG